MTSISTQQIGCQGDSTIAAKSWLVPAHAQLILLFTPERAVLEEAYLAAELNIGL